MDLVKTDAREHDMALWNGGELVKPYQFKFHLNDPSLMLPYKFEYVIELTQNGFKRIFFNAVQNSWRRNCVLEFLQNCRLCVRVKTVIIVHPML